VPGACRQKWHKNPINGLNFTCKMVEAKKNGKSVLSDEHGRSCAQHGLCVNFCLIWYGRGCARHARAFCQDFGFCVFYAFSSISVLNWPLVCMKVLGNFVSFPMALVWLENVLWIFSYDGNTPSGSWRNFKET